MIGFVLWYRGMEKGGKEKVGKIKIIKNFLGMMMEEGVEGEKVRMGMVEKEEVVVV